MSTVVWIKAEEYLGEKLKQSQQRLESFEGSDIQLGRLQGEIKCLKSMLNLPEALLVLENHDKEVSESA